MPDQKLPYSEQWSLSIQHVFMKDYTAQLSYVGTKGIHLPMQIQLNRQADYDCDQQSSAVCGNA